MSLREELLAYSRVSRMEYIPLEAPGALVPLFLAATSVSDLLSPYVLEALAILVLTFAAAFMANSLADVEVDSRYKTYVSDAVRHLGQGTVVGLIAAHIILAMALAVHLSIFFDDFRLLLWVAVGIVVALSYSLKPVHLKIRGPFQVLHNIFSLIMLCLLYYVVGGVPPTSVVVFFVGVLIAHYGVELVNQARDFFEDREVGLRTPAVLYGITRTLEAALWVTLLGLTIGAVGLFMELRTLPDLAIGTLSTSYRSLLLVSLAILAAAYWLPLRGTWSFIEMSRLSPSDEDRIAQLKERLDYPRWQLTGVLGVTLVATLTFAWRIW